MTAVRFRRPRKAAACILLGSVVALVASCGHSPSPRYYTLRVPAPPAVGDPANRATGFVLGVEPFRSTDILRDDRILYYESPTQLGFYERHRWVTEPAAMLQELAERRLQQTGVFAQVRSGPLREPVDYALKGRLFSLEEIDYDGGVKGRIGLELSLLRSRDRKIVWSARRQAETAVRQQGVPGVVSALDDMVNALLEEMTRAIVAQVESDLQAPAGRTTP